MRRLLTAAEAKAIDRYTIEQIGVPSLVLMERAALAVAEECERLLAAITSGVMGVARGVTTCKGRGTLADLQGSSTEKSAVPGLKILCVCGTGNNGADGVAVARILWLRGYRTEILLAGNEERGTEEFRIQLKAARNLQIPVCKANEPMEYIKEGEYALIVDALFGVGLTRPVEGIYAELIDQMNRSGAPIVAVDLPSGVSADDGKVCGCAVRADVTVTFGEEKLGMILYPGTEYCGKRVIAEIGLATEQYFGAAMAVQLQGVLDAEGKAERLRSTDGSCRSSRPLPTFTYDKTDLNRLPKRPAYSNKGTFGRVLVIAGSPNMGGAALFAGMAAYRMGAGLVEIATAKENRTFLQEALPEAILTIYDNTIDPKEWLIPAMNRAKAIIMGPGLGTEGNGAEILSILLAQANVPLVIDADGLNLLAGSEELQESLSARRIAGDQSAGGVKNVRETEAVAEGVVYPATMPQTILTPHLGEMSRLTGKSVKEIQSSLIASAREYSRKTGAICVMKDARTIVASPDGRIYVNTSGNSGMATGGSGDLLTGIIAALLAEGMDVFESACLGVYLHGLYGDKARERYGERTMIASDLAKIIGETE